MSEVDSVRSEHILFEVDESTLAGYSHILVFLCGFSVDVDITEEMAEDFVDHIGSRYYLAEEADGSLTVYEVKQE